MNWEEGPHQKATNTSALILDSPGSSAVKNKVLLFINSPDMVFDYSSPSGLTQGDKNICSSSSEYLCHLLQPKCPARQLM